MSQRDIKSVVQLGGNAVNKKENRMTRSIQGLLLLDMIVWIVLGGMMLDKQALTAVDSAIFQRYIGLMMIGNALIFGVLAFSYRKPHFRNITVVWLMVNIVLTFPDQFGLYDVLTLMLDVLIVVLILVQKKRYPHN